MSKVKGKIGERLVKAVFALALMAAGGGIAVLAQRWDDISNRILIALHQPHFKKPVVIEPRMQKIMVTGEVVDAWCYASQTMGPGRGQGHLACATACIAGGVTPGILEEKTNVLYIAAKYKGYRGCKDLLFPLVGKTVTVEGWVGDLGGNRVLKIERVLRAGP